MTTDRITPADIDAVTFTNVGLFHTHAYDETEVDDYLDDLAEQVAADMRALGLVKGMAQRYAAQSRRGSAVHALCELLLTVVDHSARPVEALPSDLDAAPPPADAAGPFDDRATIPAVEAVTRHQSAVSRICRSTTAHTFGRGAATT